MMRKVGWLSALAMLALVGCTQMEQRSDLPDKKALVAIDAPLTINKKWLSDTGNGTDSKDVKLLLVQNNKKLYVVDACGDLTVINETTGEKIWELSLKVPVSSGPAVAEDKLVVATSNGKVVAVDLVQHKVVWISNATSEILATPKIADDVVYIHTMDGGLSALSMLDGRQLWRFTHNLPPLMLRRSSSPVLQNDLLVAGFANGKLLGMNKNDGVVIWSQEISRPQGTTDLQRMIDISADPLIKDDKVYSASYQGNIAALSINNGNIIWERDVPSYAGFIIDKNLLYVPSTNGSIVALDIHGGTTYWVQTELEGRLLSKPALMGKYLVIADDDGNIYWLDKATGKIVGRYELDKEGVEATPVVNNNTVYILGRSGALIALEVG